MNVLLMDSLLVTCIVGMVVRVIVGIQVDSLINTVITFDVAAGQQEWLLFLYCWCIFSSSASFLCFILCVNFVDICLLLLHHSDYLPLPLTHTPQNGFLP